MAVVLIPEDVPSGQARHVEVVAQLLLFGRELVPTRHLIPKDPHIGELIGLPAEVRSGGGGIRQGWIVFLRTSATGDE